MADKERITTTEANIDFANVAKMAEQEGHVYLYENNEPKMLLINLDKEPQIQMTEEEKFEFVTHRILREHIEAFKELAK